MRERGRDATRYRAWDVNSVPNMGTLEREWTAACSAMVLLLQSSKTEEAISESPDGQVREVFFALKKSEKGVGRSHQAAKRLMGIEQTSNGSPFMSPTSSSATTRGKLRLPLLR